MEKDIKNLSEIIFYLKQEIFEFMKEYYTLSINLNPNKNSYDELCEILIGEITVDESNPISVNENKKRICLNVLQERCNEKTTYYRKMIEEIDEFFNDILCIKKPCSNNTCKLLLKYYNQNTIKSNCENLSVLLNKFKNKSKSQEILLEELLNDKLKLIILKKIRDYDRQDLQNIFNTLPKRNKKQKPISETDSENDISYKLESDRETYKDEDDENDDEEDLILVKSRNSHRHNDSKYSSSEKSIENSEDDYKYENDTISKYQKNHEQSKEYYPEETMKKKHSKVKQNLDKHERKSSSKKKLKKHKNSNNLKTIKNNIYDSKKNLNYEHVREKEIDKKQESEDKLNKIEHEDIPIIEENKKEEKPEIIVEKNKTEELHEQKNYENFYLHKKDEEEKIKSDEEIPSRKIVNYMPNYLFSDSD